MAIDFVEPRLNFRSLEHIPQGQSTHFGHVAKLERFMKDVDSAEIERAVEKRRDDLARRLDVT